MPGFPFARAVPHHEWQEMHGISGVFENVDFRDPLQWAIAPTENGVGAGGSAQCG
jgi:hypothetical protein